MCACVCLMFLFFSVALDACTARALLSVLITDYHFRVGVSRRHAECEAGNTDVLRLICIYSRVPIHMLKPNPLPS